MVVLFRVANNIEKKIKRFITEERERVLECAGALYYIAHHNTTVTFIPHKPPIIKDYSHA
tara:strand:+ start:617 stop:796 length:180 start_codon:yes stop_codon:yes gene_type:complete